MAKLVYYVKQGICGYLMRGLGLILFLSWSHHLNYESGFNFH